MRLLSRTREMITAAATRVSCMVRQSTTPHVHWMPHWISSLTADDLRSDAWGVSGMLREHSRTCPTCHRMQPPALHATRVAAGTCVHVTECRGELGGEARQSADDSQAPMRTATWKGRHPGSAQPQAPSGPLQQ